MAIFSSVTAYLVGEELSNFRSIFAFGVVVRKDRVHVLSLVFCT